MIFEALRQGIKQNKNWQEEMIKVRVALTLYKIIKSDVYTGSINQTYILITTVSIAFHVREHCFPFALNLI